LKRLEKDGHEIRALVRENSEHGLDAVPESAEVVRGNVLDDDLEKHLEGVEAVIHLVGIIREDPAKGMTFDKLHTQATQKVINAMKKAGVKRLAHMSALGVGPEDWTGYFRTKREEEEAVKNSGLDFTIFRPSVIYSPRDEFVNMLSMQVKLMPILPVLGDGKYLLQPVSANDVAAGFVKCLSMDETIGKTYEVGGPEQMNYDQILDEVALAMGKRPRPKIHIPLALMRPVIRALDGFQFFPVTEGQLEMLLMSNVCDPAPYAEDFGIELTSFREGIGAYM